MSGVVVPGDDKKPVAEGSSSHVNIMVKSMCNGSDVYFRTKRNTPLRKLMNAYCEITKFVPNISGEIYFLYDGKRIKPEDTPHQEFFFLLTYFIYFPIFLGLKDEDHIDVNLTLFWPCGKPQNVKKMQGVV
ncbi:hypothetical protein MKW92_000927 [Papaver armeniacum]|nr:hypothetical protein MKW92_000927 [Papaver armeniacum]